MSFITNALGIGPAQQAASNQAQQNYSQGVSNQASQLAQQTQQQALANAFLRFQQYMQTNPQFAQTLQSLTGPTQNTGTVGGGMVGSNGTMGMASPNGGIYGAASQLLHRGQSPSGVSGGQGLYGAIGSMFNRGGAAGSGSPAIGPVASGGNGSMNMPGVQQSMGMRGLEALAKMGGLGL